MVRRSPARVRTHASCASFQATLGSSGTTRVGQSLRDFLVELDRRGVLVDQREGLRGFVRDVEQRRFAAGEAVAADPLVVSGPCGPQQPEDRERHRCRPENAGIERRKRFVADLRSLPSVCRSPLANAAGVKPAPRLADSASTVKSAIPAGSSGRSLRSLARNAGSPSNG